ncbi:PAS domain S-box-containing protein [Oceanospirillum multiglobuliferum]|uniref:histidine kinase n=1 Tax=Oceanospirillum multiglobuliferum TaxID=64969 RepID=A0A1T4PZ39_9GAMM|nr:PAS domain S-box protein [Oceanospirillum multiglobuliferum]OPX55436.1 hypothetical protein BTE48_08575 [Oceanospirillum multiglobuliferum]SJZ96606.1 PAS domain S-box-containing protein [Oceanospirillum multiglobuliferum]
MTTATMTPSTILEPTLELQKLLQQFMEDTATADLILSVLQTMIRLSDSQSAFLLPNNRGADCSGAKSNQLYWQYHAGYEGVKKQIEPHLTKISHVFQPELCRTEPLFANTSCAVLTAFKSTLLWHSLGRVAVIPLQSSMGLHKGVLILAGRDTPYYASMIEHIEPFISFCMNLLLLDQKGLLGNSHTSINNSQSIPISEPKLEQFKPFFDHSVLPHVITDVDGTIQQCNAATEQLLGYPENKLVGQHIARFIPKIKLSLHHLEQEKSLQELKAYTRQGIALSIRANTQPLIEDESLQFNITLQDLRRNDESKAHQQAREKRIQKQIRSTLRIARMATQEQAPFAQLVQQICELTAETLQVLRVGIWLAEENSPIFRNLCQIDLNQSAYSECLPLILTSKNPFVRQIEQVQVLALGNLSESKNSSHFLSSDYYQRNKVQTLMSAGIIKEGQLIGFLVIEESNPVLWQEDQFNFAREVANYLHILVLSNQRQRIQSALALQEEQFRLLFFDSPMPMLAFDQESFQFISVNDAATKEFGYSKEEIAKKGIYDLVPPSCVLDIHNIVSANAQKQHDYHVLETKMQKHSGEIIDVEIHSHAITLSNREAILMVALDITQKKRIEQSLRQKQKMEAIGQLVGGIAHDFNNITNIIRGHTELLELKLVNQDKAQKHIQAIFKATTRTTSLTHKLMQFSRQQQISSEPLQVNDVISDLVEFMSKSLTNNIQILLELDHSTPTVLIDRGDFEDVLINLAINARDAMERQGTLTIKTSQHTLSEDHVLMTRDRQAGRYVCVRVQDTGTGIPQEIREQIFDPFFTTKDKGKGTGLGLSMVYGFAKRSGGFLDLESIEGKGSSFQIWLPVLEQDKTTEKIETQDEAHLIPELKVPEGTQALVVDDEEDIRSALSEMVSSFGFVVTEASSADQAIQVIQSGQHNFSLMLSDIIMPGSMNGVALAHWAKEQRSNLRIILASGYSENISVIDARKVSCHLLKKPFGRQDLLKVLSSWDWPKNKE